ncbi:uncharacterized protein TNCV_1750121 [Trichonephila clavipes]|nr:uncharacterized protein TNCV_1750121 [Trichonephila clavipes]
MGGKIFWWGASSHPGVDPGQRRGHSYSEKESRYYALDLDLAEKSKEGLAKKYRIVAGLVMSSSPVPLKTHRVGQRCTLNLSRAETSSRWCGVVVRGGSASSGVLVTWPWFKKALV